MRRRAAELHPKDGASVPRRLHTCSPIHGRPTVFDDGQPQPSAPLGRGSARVHTIKALKDAFWVFFFDTRSVIGRLSQYCLVLSGRDLVEFVPYAASKGCVRTVLFAERRVLIRHELNHQLAGPLVVILAKLQTVGQLAALITVAVFTLALAFGDLLVGPTGNKDNEK